MDWRLWGRGWTRRVIISRMRTTVVLKVVLLMRRSGSVRVLEYTVYRGNYKLGIYAEIALSISFVFLRANFEYYVPFNFGYIGEIAPPPHPLVGPVRTRPKPTYFENHSSFLSLNRRQCKMKQSIPQSNSHGARIFSSSACSFFVLRRLTFFRHIHFSLLLGIGFSG